MIAPLLVAFGIVGCIHYFDDKPLTWSDHYLPATCITLGFGIFSLFKGGDFARSHSNKLMRLRVVLQFVAIVLLVAAFAWRRYVH